MNGLDSGRENVSHLMIEQAQAEAGTLPGGTSALAHDASVLPLRLVYVDRSAGALVVGLAKESEADSERHQERLRSIVGDLKVVVRYVTVTPDTCPDVTKDCRPIRGGVRVNSAGTLSIVILQNVNNPTPFTIISSHVVGVGIDRPVGQPTQAGLYGRVTVNPPLANRTSDAALANITNNRVTTLPYAIWAGPNDEYFTVVGFDGNVAIGNEVLMQGAHSVALAEGAITDLGMTVRDHYGVLTGQALATYPAQGGDSGAPVFSINESNNTAIYHGIHAGRVQLDDRSWRSYFSTWDNIARELNIVPVNIPRE